MKFRLASNERDVHVIRQVTNVLKGTIIKRIFYLPISLALHFNVQQISQEDDIISHALSTAEIVDF